MNNNISSMKKIQYVSRVLLPLFYLGKFLFPLIMLGLLVFLIISSTSTSTPLYSTNITLGMINDGLLTLTDKLISATNIIYVCIFATVGCHFCICLLKQFQSRVIFCQPSIKYAKGIANIFGGYVLISTLMTLCFREFISIKVDLVFNDYTLLGFMWLFIWILEIGTYLHNENEMTI